MPFPITVLPTDHASVQQPSPHLSPDPFLAKARRDQQAYGLPEYLYQQYRSQYGNAKQRGIAFGFTMLEWVMWWRIELRKKGEKATRGNRKGQYMMCRFGDRGGYESGNVYCGTAYDNMNDVDWSGAAEKHRQRHALVDCHLKGKRGDDHPKSRAVVDHLGQRWGSIALASEEYGITRQGGFYRIRTGKWQYADLTD